jgi:hypothetical protein
LRAHRESLPLKFLRLQEQLALSLLFLLFFTTNKLAR